jgi:hypothetical protein
VLDEATQAHCLHVQKLAEEQGYPLFDLLERAGLIVSDDKRTMIMKATIAMALLQLEDQQHTTLAQIGGGQTVTGAVQGCIKFLELYAKGLG